MQLYVESDTTGSTSLSLTSFYLTMTTLERSEGHVFTMKTCFIVHMLLDKSITIITQGGKMLNSKYVNNIQFNSR